MYGNERKMVNNEKRDPALKENVLRCTGENAQGFALGGIERQRLVLPCKAMFGGVFSWGAKLSGKFRAISSSIPWWPQWPIVLLGEGSSKRLIYTI